MYKIAIYMPESFDIPLLNYALEISKDIIIISNNCDKFNSEFNCISINDENQLKNFDIIVLRSNSIISMNMKALNIENLLSRLGVKMLIIH
ncbi:MAG: hypothetical protein ACP5JT_04355 [Thermoplasmata archaeon]|jgi:hypothetical protein